MQKNCILPNTDNQHWLVAEHDRDYAKFGDFLQPAKTFEPDSKYLE